MQRYAEACGIRFVANALRIIDSDDFDTLAHAAHIIYILSFNIIYILLILYIFFIYLLSIPVFPPMQPLARGSLIKFNLIASMDVHVVPSPPRPPPRTCRPS